MRGGRTYIVGVEGEAWVCQGPVEVQLGQADGRVTVTELVARPAPAAVLRVTDVQRLAFVTVGTL